MAWTNGPSRTGTAQWKRVRKIVLERDNHTCQKCGATGVPLQAAHIIAHREGGSDHPDNIRALCDPCHKPETQADSYRRRHYRRPRQPSIGEVERSRRRS